MKHRVKKKFYGLDKKFDTWWDKKNGGSDYYNKLKSQKKYSFWKDPLGKRKRNKLIIKFNKYIIAHGLE